MSANLGGLVVDLALESAEFMAGMRAAQAQAQSSSKAISTAMSVGKTALGGLAGVLSVSFLADQVQGAFDFGDAIVDLSDRTGASTKAIQEFRYAAQLSGSSVESADTAVEKFAKNLGSALNAPTALGKQLRDLGVKSNDTDVALRQFMDGIAKLPTVAQRNAAATAVMGKSAGDLTVLLSGGSRGFDELAQAARSYGIVLDDAVLRNGGKVNDQLDTMKMILNAQMAGAILQNADALFTLAQGFISAATAASQFFQQMDINRSLSVINANGLSGVLNMDVPKLISGVVRGKSADQMRSEEAQHLLTTKMGRNALYDTYKQRYNQNNASGMSPDSQEQRNLKADMRAIAQAEVNARRSLRPPTAPVVNLPTAPQKPKSSPKAPTVNLRSDEELAYNWNRDYQSATLDQYRANLDLMVEPQQKTELQKQISGIEYNGRLRDIDYDTGTDREVKEGKKRYTAAQAEELKQIEEATQSFRLQNLDNEASELLAQQKLAASTAALDLQHDDLTSQAALARSTKQRRDIALNLVANEFEQQKLAQEAIIASGQSTQAEKEIAKAKLAMLPYLKDQATAAARKQNQSPMEAYLDAIPQTADEINDQLETVETQGLDSLQDGLLGVIKGTEDVGEAFHHMVDGILDGLLKIALQQAIIKPLGSLLFGGDSGGGLGGIFGSIVKGIGGAALGGGLNIQGASGSPVDLSAFGVGARANGGYTGAGDYLVGERGPELVSIGANAHVTPTAGLDDLQRDGGGGGLTIQIASITSNDPVMVRRMVAEGVMQAIPAITDQATNRTIAKLRRPGL